MSISSIIQGLRTYKDRMDEDKISMRSWLINTWSLLDNKDMPEELKLWCKLAVTSSVQIYEFLIDNYRNSFKGVKAEGGLKEIIAYLAFSSLISGGDNLLNKLEMKGGQPLVCGQKAEAFGKKEFDSIDEFTINIADIFGFTLTSQTYQRFNSNLMTYKQTRERNPMLEAQLLLFAIITETNPPMKEIPPEMKLGFMQHLVNNAVMFNQMLKEKGLI